MEKKIRGLGSKAAETGKSVASLLGKARDTVVKAVDQNDDGAFDMKDVSAIAGTIGGAAKAAVSAAKDTVEEKSREFEQKNLQPVFPEDIDSVDFLMPKLVRIAEIDKKHAESALCTGAIGHIIEQKELKVANIYPDQIEAFNLKFYPDINSELYYIDPCDSHHYIALDDYFRYMKEARVNELQRIARDLGATHFRVTYKEQRATLSTKDLKTKATAKVFGAASEAEYMVKENETASIQIAAEMTCIGHAPIEPKLQYMQKENSIQTLISLRMNESGPLTHQKYTLQLSNSAGIKERDAIKIDAVLKAMKISGNTTLVSEVQNESRRFFEYEIDF